MKKIKFLQIELIFLNQASPPPIQNQTDWVRIYARWHFRNKLPSPFSSVKLILSIYIERSELIYNEVLISIQPLDEIYIYGRRFKCQFLNGGDPVVNWDKLLKSCVTFST